AGRFTDETCEAEALIVVAPLHTDVAGEAYPTVLYYARRRGWNVDTDGWTVGRVLTAAEDGARRGARCLVVTSGPAFEPSVVHTLPGFSGFTHDRDQNQ